MKSARMSGLVVSAIAFAFASASASAGDKDKYDVDCSPGYWKNHQEVWVPDACSELDCNGLLYLLYITGPKSGVFKNFAGNLINGWATDNEVTANCND
jgi:hypothetical protein